MLWSSRTCAKDVVDNHFNGNDAPALTAISEGNPGRFRTSLEMPSAFIVASPSEHGMDFESEGHTAARTITSSACSQACLSRMFCGKSRSSTGKRALVAGILAPAKTLVLAASRTVMTMVSVRSGLICGFTRYKRAEYEGGSMVSVATHKETS